jgi:carboxylesterase
MQVMTEHRACLLIHGFSGGPFEVGPLSAYLESFGWSCSVPTLPGHGKYNQQMKHICYQDWIQAAEVEAEKIVKTHGSFDLVGFSMGGLISAYLANRYPVRRLILLNAAVIYVSPLRLAQATFEQIKHKDWSRFHKVGHTPMRATWQFVQLVHHLKPEIKQVDVPTLVIQGERDQVIHPSSANYIYRNLWTKQKQVEYFQRSKHLICLEEEADEVFKIVYNFLQG